MSVRPSARNFTCLDSSANLTPQHPSILLGSSRSYSNHWPCFCNWASVCGSPLATRETKATTTMASDHRASVNSRLREDLTPPSGIRSRSVSSYSSSGRLERSRSRSPRRPLHYEDRHQSRRYRESHRDDPSHYSTHHNTHHDDRYRDNRHSRRRDAHYGSRYEDHRRSRPYDARHESHYEDSRSGRHHNNHHSSHHEYEHPSRHSFHRDRGGDRSRSPHPARGERYERVRDEPANSNHSRRGNRDRLDHETHSRHRNRGDNEELNSEPERQGRRSISQTWVQRSLYDRFTDPIPLQPGTADHSASRGGLQPRRGSIPQGQSTQNLPYDQLRGHEDRRSGNQVSQSQPGFTRPGTANHGNMQQRPEHRPSPGGGPGYGPYSYEAMRRLALQRNVLPPLLQVDKLVEGLISYLLTSECSSPRSNNERHPVPQTAVVGLGFGRRRRREGSPELDEPQEEDSVEDRNKRRLEARERLRSQGVIGQGETVSQMRPL